MSQFLTDLLVSILEKGIVVVIKLHGDPGDRQFLVGLGLPQAVDPMLVALGVSGVLRRPEYADDWFGQ